MALLNTLMAFNPISGNYVGYAVVAVVALIVLVLLAFVKKEIIYVDPDTDYEIAHQKYGWGKKVVLETANKKGKKFIGWSYNEDGDRRVHKKKIRLFRTTELYAVWEKPLVGIAIEDANAALEFVYIDDATGEEMSKEVCPFSVNVPMEVRGEAILGWALDPSQGPLVTASEEDKSVLTVELYPVREGWDEVVEEEPVEEEPAPVVVEEEPVEEAPAPVVAVEPEEEPNATVEFVYMDDEDKEINKDVAPLTLTVPMEVNGEAIIGWGLDSKSAPIIKVDEENGTVTIQLYPVREGWDEVVEEPVEEEPIAEEPVVEPEVVEPVVVAVEEPVEEEPVVEEEPAEELFEEVIEEPMPVVEEPVAEEVAEEAPVVEEEVVIAPVIVPTYIDGNGNELNIKYSRSFLANVIQAEDGVKDFYSQIKNHILSYKGVKARNSWKFESFNKGREQLIKLKLRGKTICMYCALNPDEFDKSKYHHDAVDAKIFAAVPMLVKIKSNLGLKKAKELVDIIMAKFAIEANPKAKTVDYVAEHPYEDTPTLIGKELIKVLQADDSLIVKAEPTPEAPAEEEVVVEIVEEEVVVEEPVVEVEPEIVVAAGNELNIRYSRSFLANVIQAEDGVKDFYSQIKNHILSYKGVKARNSWKFESFNKGREQLIKLKLRGKTICMYCALNPDEFDKSKYHHDAVDAKIFAAVPMLVKIKSNLGLKKAKELVDIIMAKFAIEANPKAKTVDYVAEHPYEDTPTLIGKELIKVLDNSFEVAVPVAEPVAEEPVIEEAVAEPEIVEEPAVEEEPVIEEAVEEAPTEVAEEEPIVEEPVAEEVVEEEPVVEVAPEVEAFEEAQEAEPEEEPAPAQTVEEMKIVESVSADEVDDLVVDEVVDSLVEHDVEYITEDDTKKAIVNVDTLSEEFETGDVVDLATLKEKGIIPANAKALKVLARGVIDKALTVKAGEFSEQALKMIVLTGGTAIKTVYKIK